MQVWRLVPEERADTAFTGFGAWKFGGRWNPKGYTVAYLAENLALAALEQYVHLPPAARGKAFLAYRVTFPETIAADQLASLPSDWEAEPVPASTQEAGRAWLEGEGRSGLLSVPSVVVPQERNLMADLSHPDWQQAKIAEPERFVFDPRMR